MLDDPSWHGFVTLHAWICQLHVDLNRFALPGIREQAASEVKTALPTAFIKQCERQAVAWAISFSNFWESLQHLVRRRPPGPGRLLIIDFPLTVCVLQVTKVLLIAKQHRLCHDLTESSAPLATEAVDDDTIDKLIRSNIDILDDVAMYIPRIGELVSDFPVSSHAFYLIMECSQKRSRPPSRITPTIPRINPTSPLLAYLR